MTMLDEAKQLSEQLVTWRKALHQIPELGLNLPKTTAYISEQLTAMGVQHEVKEDISCVFALIGQGEKCILLRGDIDALPVEEHSGEEFASTNGWSHACGHDMHATTMLGVAKLLKAHESELKVTVKLLFQSAEETFQGAQAAIDAGVLENPHVDAAYGMHVFAGYDVGTVNFGEIPMGAVYGFKMTLTGRGGHGSQPEVCIDPINAGVQVYLALQSLIARECPPMKPATLTIGQFAAGQVNNAIPETCVLQGTLRTFDNDVREYLIRRINEISRATAETYRCKFEIEVASSVPSVYNDPEFSKYCLAKMEKSGAMKKLETGFAVMGSEDFAHFSKYVPSCYVVAGAGVEDVTRRRGQHNPEIVFNMDALAGDVAIYTQIAMDFADWNV